MLDAPAAQQGSPSEDESGPFTRAGAYGARSWRRTDRRYSRSELAAIRAGACPVHQVNDERLAELVDFYERLTSEQLAIRGQQYLATCARIHGPATEDRLREAWAAGPTTINLLADVRRLLPGERASVKSTWRRRWDGTVELGPPEDDDLGLWR